MGQRMAGARADWAEADESRTGSAELVHRACVLACCLVFLGPWDALPCVCVMGTVGVVADCLRTSECGHLCFYLFPSC